MSHKSSSSLAGVLAGFFDLILTVGAMLAANSSVLLADTLKTLLEFAAVLISWYTLRRIAKGADQKFEYGMGKLENISSLAVAGLMTCCIVVIVINAVRNIMHPAHIEGIGIWISMAAQIIYVVVNSVLFVKNRRLAKLEASPMLASQSQLFFSKAIGNVFILASLLLSTFVTAGWGQYIDPAASMIIAFSIFMSAMGIFSTSIFDLLDRTLEESAQIIILRVLAKHFDEYELLHGIRSRHSGSQVFIEIFLEFNSALTVGKVQNTIDAIKTELESEIKNGRVTIGLTHKEEC